MILLTPKLRFALRANAINAQTAERDGKPEPDPVPVVKFFNPLGAARWLATELYDDDDTCFGLADLGFGCPELGTFSLSEMAGVRLPFGLGIERDIAFEGLFPLSVYAAAARRIGTIVEVERTLREIAAAIGKPNSELPPPPKTNGDG